MACHADCVFLCCTSMCGKFTNMTRVGKKTFMLTKCVVVSRSTSLLHINAFAGFHTGFFSWGGEEVCEVLPQCRARGCSTHTLVCVQARGIWGYAPPPQKISF